MENVNRRPVAMTLVVLGAVARLVPHPWNFAPVGGMSLFAGARLRGWWAWALPIVLMAITVLINVVGTLILRRATIFPTKRSQNILLVVTHRDGLPYCRITEEGMGFLLYRLAVLIISRLRIARICPIQ
jgi:hypothetical protein